MCSDSNTQSPVVNLYDETDELFTARTGDGRAYDAIYDDMTGDWLVRCENDDMIQGFWFLTRDGAIQYILEHLGIIENGSYERAPDRC